MSVDDIEEDVKEEKSEEEIELDRCGTLGII